MRRRAPLFILSLFSACSGGQISENFAVSFPNTVVCESTTQLIQFTNDTGGEMIIEGAAISAGTDSLGNFSLEGIVVGTTEIASVGGAIPQVTVPPGEKYLFKVDYNPRTGNTTHTAIIDIVFEEPMGVHQLYLSGTATGVLEGNCVSLSEGAAVNFDGPLTLTVTKLVVATSKLGSALSSDDGIVPLTGISLPITLDLHGGNVTFPKITEANQFILSRPKQDVPILGRAMTQDTLITTVGDATGTYDPSVGSLTIENLSVTLDTDFNTTIETTLTTDQISLSTFLPQRINSGALPAFGDLHFHSDPATGGDIFGQRIDPETGELALVGTTVITSSTLDPGANNLFSPDELQGVAMAILIEGTVASP